MSVCKTEVCFKCTQFSLFWLRSLSFFHSALSAYSLKLPQSCFPFSVPAEFNNLLQYYTKQGFRVIGAAHKALKHGMKFSEVDELSRNQLEEGADFLGLIIMQNLVKKETYGAIAELHKADIVTLMVTGDNIQTAISVGRDCELVKAEQTIIRVTADDSTGQVIILLSDWSNQIT